MILLPVLFVASATAFSARPTSVGFGMKVQKLPPQPTDGATGLSRGQQTSGLSPSSLQLLTGRMATDTYLSNWSPAIVPTGYFTIGGTRQASTKREASPNLAHFDLDRVKIRLDGLSSYGVVTALIMNAGLRLYSATPKKMGTESGPDDSADDKRRQKIENFTKVLFGFSVVASILAGAYTTVVFSLLGLYSKTALGLRRDLQYLEFISSTAQIRETAFDSFLLSLVAFEISFVSSIFLQYKGRVRWWLSGAATIAIFATFWQWSSIMTTASKLLF